MSYEFLFRISVCFLLSFLVGIERQYIRRIVGLRTSILVAIGSFLFVTFSFSIGAADISRIASQVVAGMGFLGAGVILKDGKKISGLTTAATLWCTAGIGVLCAGGAVFEAIVGTVIILFSNIMLRYINKLVNNISQNNDLHEYVITINGNNRNIEIMKKELDEYYKHNNIEVNRLNLTKEMMESNLSYNLVLKKIDIKNLEEILMNNKIKSFNISKKSVLKTDEFED